MTSDSEHTNRPRPPQQAPGRQWPILVLLLGVVTLALALTACGGSSSTSTPGATTGSPPTAISAPASTPTPKPTETSEVGESTGIRRETQEYIETLCALRTTKQEPATWGEEADKWQKDIDFIEKNEPPEELRDFFEASVTLNRLRVRFAEERRSLAYEGEDAQHAFNKNPERTEALQTVFNAQGALDDAVREAIEAINKC